MPVAEKDIDVSIHLFQNASVFPSVIFYFKYYVCWRGSIQHPRQIGIREREKEREREREREREKIERARGLVVRFRVWCKGSGLGLELWG